MPIQVPIQYRDIPTDWRDGPEDWRRYGDSALKQVDYIQTYTPWFYSDSERSALFDIANAEREWERELYSWNLNNAYNSPSAQMQRLKDAGLNPMLAYQNMESGNSSGGPQPPTVRSNLHPQSERLNMLMSGVSMLTGLVGAITSMTNQAYDLRIKRNEADLSDYLAATRYQNLNGYGVGSVFQRNQNDITQLYNTDGSINFMDIMNPESPYFDPSFMAAYMSTGQVPEQLYTYYRDVPKRAFDTFRASYQKYYNENLLPKFNEFQQGKIDLQEFEKAFEAYQKEVREMIPPELRGILEPLMEWFGPLFKIVFKASKGKVNLNHNVKTIE